MAIHTRLICPKTFGYTPAVSSKKGLIGIGVSCNRCDESRSSPADHAALLSVPPFMVARMGGRKARRFAQAVHGTPTCSSHRPQLALEHVYAETHGKPIFVSYNGVDWDPV